MIRGPYNLNPYNSTIDTSKVNNFSFTFSGDELGSWNIEIAKNNTSPEIVYTSEEFVPEDVGYTHIYDDDIVEGITLPSTIAHSQDDDGLLRRLYSINGYPFNAAVVKLNINGIENIGNIKGSTANGYLVATNYSLGRTGSNVTIIGFDRDGTTIGSQVTDGTYDFLGYLLSVKENSNIEIGQVVQIGENSFIIGSIEDAGDGYSELTIVNGEATSSDVTPILTFDSLAEADVTELTVGIEPVQDLNGYDKPWVGGAGKNLCPNVGWVQGQLGNNGTLGSQSFSISSDYIFLEVGTYVVSRSYSGGSAGNLAYHSYNTAKVWQSDSGWLINPFIITVTEPIFIRFTTRKDTSDALSPSDVDGAFKIQLEQGSTATAWTPYENICPITGHDEVTVTWTGKNLLDNTVKSGQTLTSNGVSCTINSAGFVAVSGTATSGTINAWFVDGYGTGFKLKRFLAGTYTFTDFIPFYHYVDETNLRSVPTSFSSRSATYTFTKDWWLDGVRCPAAETGTEYNLTLYPQMELGATATSFEPYRSNAHTTSLGQTVYGGTLDMVTGVLTVDKAMVSLSGSDLNIGSGTTKEVNMWRLPLNNPYGTLASSYPSGISNKYVLRNAYHEVNNNNGSVGLNRVDGSQILIRDDSLTTAQEVIDAFNSTPLTFVYPLATPLTYTLTAQQIKTLIGTNNVWASSGDIISIKFTYEIN